jgi:large subunit ribosomal protein L10
MKSRAERQAEIEMLSGEFRQSPHVFLVGFEKLPVGKDWELRRKLRDAGLKYRVVKNRLAQLAARGTPVEAMSDYFTGMTAVALSRGEPVALAKVLRDFARDNPQVAVKGAVVEGRAVDVKNIEAIANLPGRPELMAKVMGLVNAPAQQLVTAVNGVVRNLVVVLGQIRDQKAKETQDPSPKSQDPSPEEIVRSSVLSLES